MDNLYIEATQSSPKVELNATSHILEFSGQSYPENASKFYQPILAWVKNHLENVDKQQLVTGKFNIKYFNTSSSKAIMDLLDFFDEACEAGKNVEINWYYHEENELALECGEEFQEEFSMPFKLIEL